MSQYYQINLVSVYSHSTDILLNTEKPYIVQKLGVSNVLCVSKAVY